MTHIQSLARDYAEKTYREALSMSIYCHAHPLTSLRHILRKQNVVTYSELRRIPHGATVRVSGMLVIIHTPPTKSGKRVMFLTLEDETGLLDVVVFSRAQERFARIILTSDVLTLEGKLQRRGVRGISTSVVMGKVLLPYSGNLTQLLSGKLRVHVNQEQKVCGEKRRDFYLRRDQGPYAEQLSFGYFED